MVISNAVIVARFDNEPKDIVRKLRNSLRGIEHTIKTPIAEDDSFLVVIEYWGTMPNKTSFKERAGFLTVTCKTIGGLVELTESYLYT